MRTHPSSVLFAFSECPWRKRESHRSQTRRQGAPRVSATTLSWLVRHQWRDPRRSTERGYATATERVYKGRIAHRQQRSHGEGRRSRRLPECASEVYVTAGSRALGRRWCDVFPALEADETRPARPSPAAGSGHQARMATVRPPGAQLAAGHALRTQTSRRGGAKSPVPRDSATTGMGAPLAVIGEAG